MTSETRPARQGSKRARSGSRTGITKKAASTAAAKPASKTTKKKSAKKTAAKKTVTKQAAKKTTTRKSAVKQRATASKAAPAVAETIGRSVSADERRRMIAEAAYYRAERLGGRVDPTRNWLAAEAEIDAMLMGENRAD